MLLKELLEISTKINHPSSPFMVSIRKKILDLESGKMFYPDFRVNMPWFPIF